VDPGKVNAAKRRKLINGSIGLDDDSGYEFALFLAP
jgi:hypothetical protein